jgi:hypothetical protein
MASLTGDGAYDRDDVYGAVTKWSHASIIDDPGPPGSIGSWAVV